MWYAVYRVKRPLHYFVEVPAPQTGKSGAASAALIWSIWQQPVLNQTALDLSFTIYPRLLICWRPTLHALTDTPSGETMY